MKNTQKLSDLTDLQVVQNQEEIKGGFFFLLKAFHGYNNYGGHKGGYNDGHKGGYNDGHKGGYYGGNKGGNKGGYYGGKH